MLLIFLYFCLAAALFFFTMTIINLFEVKKLCWYPDGKELPLISIILPARNEERTIRACVSSLLLQDYPNYEVIVVNDHSEDKTGEILHELKQGHPGLTVLDCPVLPAGWMGKNWACHQGYQQANSELLLFIDADTEHAPHSLRKAVAALMHEKADFLTAILFLTSVSLGERLIQPLLTCMIYTVFPFALMHRKRLTAIAYAHGAYMLFRREAYDAIGGHAAIRNNVFDDLGLSGGIRRAGLHAVTVNTAGSVHCRMYTSLGEIFNGFSKNLFRLASYSFPGYIAAPLWAVSWIFFTALYTMPAAALITCLILYLYGIPVPTGLVLCSGLAVLLSLGSFFLVCKSFGYSIRMIFTYPLQVVLFFVIAMNSMVRTLAGKTAWKGRTLPN